MSRRSFSGDRSGATAIELAFCLPILLTLVVGIFQFGWTQHQVSSIRYAMQRASRALMLNPDLTEAQVQTMVTSRLSSTANIDVEVDLTKTNTANGRLATLETTYVAAFGVPNLLQFSIPFEMSVTTALRPI